MPHKTKDLERIHGLKVITLLRNAYEDYIAARILLNHNVILQGAILANTSIEKYFKAILTFKGDSVKYSHSIKSLLPSIKDFDFKLYNTLDIDFINLIDSSYTLRYFDSVPDNHKVVLLRNKTLSDLDFTISLMANKFSVDQKNNREYKSQYNFDIESKRKELFENNYLLENIDKEIFCKGLEYVYEFHMRENRSPFEVHYQTEIK